MSEQHLHVYKPGGRCIRSVPLGGVAASNYHAASGEPTVAGRIQWQLIAMGGSLKVWHEAEQAGTISWGGEDAIVRIKPVGLMRDMLPAGARQIADAIRREGVEIEPITGDPRAAPEA